MQTGEKYNSYETVVIVGSKNNSKESSDKIIDNFIKFLKDNNSSIIDLDNWGLKKLAYKIKNEQEGYYYVIEHISPAQNIFLYETTLKRNEDVLRFLTVSLDKHAIKYNKDKREKARA